MGYWVGLGFIWVNGFGLKTQTQEIIKQQQQHCCCCASYAGEPAGQPSWPAAVLAAGGGSGPKGA